MSGCCIRSAMVWFYFFFQAEDGIRDYKVTGVQTCALPISFPGLGKRTSLAGLASSHRPEDFNAPGVGFCRDFDQEPRWSRKRKSGEGSDASINGRTPVSMVSRSLGAITRPLV